MRIDMMIASKSAISRNYYIIPLMGKGHFEVNVILTSTHPLYSVNVETTKEIGSVITIK